MSELEEAGGAEGFSRASHEEVPANYGVTRNLTKGEQENTEELCFGEGCGGYIGQDLHSEKLEPKGGEIQHQVYVMLRVPSGGHNCFANGHSDDDDDDGDDPSDRPLGVNVALGLKKSRLIVDSPQLGLHVAKPVWPRWNFELMSKL